MNNWWVEETKWWTKSAYPCKCSLSIFFLPQSLKMFLLKFQCSVSVIRVVIVSIDFWKWGIMFVVFTCHVTCWFKALEIDLCTCVTDKKRKGKYSVLFFPSLLEIERKQHCFVWLILSSIKTVLTDETMQISLMWKHLNDGECIFKQDPVNHRSASFLRHMTIQESVGGWVE